MFPSKVGTLRTANTLDAAFAICKKAAGIEKRFTVHGLRYYAASRIMPTADAALLVRGRALGRSRLSMQLDSA